MNADSTENITVSFKKFTRIMVVIAVGFVALYVFIFMQLKQTESQLTSYGNVTDSAISNFLEKLPDSDSLKIEKTVEGISFVVNDGEGSSLNADLIDGKDSSFFLNASNIQEGILKDTTFSAWKDLETEGIVVNGKIRSDFLPTANTTPIWWFTNATRNTMLLTIKVCGISVIQSTMPTSLFILPTAKMYLL